MSISPESIQAMVAMNKAISGFAIKIAAFMNAAGQPVSLMPTGQPIDPDLMRLRRDLIEEEINELFNAMYNNDIVGIADGIADILYVVIGTALTYGVPAGLVFDVVHDNNMTKINPVTGEVVRAENGKILKPEGWKPPDIAEALSSWSQVYSSYGGDESFKQYVLAAYMRNHLAQRRSILDLASKPEDKHIATILSSN